MGMLYYVWDDENVAIAALNALNNSPQFPVIGNKNGKPAPESQATTKWADAPKEMIDGRWAVLKIPDERMDFLNVPLEQRQAFLNAFNPSIEELDTDDFPAPPEEPY